MQRRRFMQTLALLKQPWKAGDASLCMHNSNKVDRWLCIALKLIFDLPVLYI